MSIRFFKPGHRPDYFIMAAVFILTVFGLVMLVSASSELGKIKFNDTYYYLKRQIGLGISIGLLGFLIASKIYYRHYKKISLALLFISIAILSLVFTKFGYVSGGAGRWLSLGPITFQPSELLKLSYIVYLAAWLSNPKNQREKNFLSGLVPFLIITGIIAGLLIAQPATSTVVILVGAGLATYFASGARLRYMFGMILLGGFILTAVIYTTPYRLNRILGFLNYENDPQGSGYHLSEALIAIGSGGFWGVGYGQSAIKSGRLPASISDSIFAVIGSELGFVGAAFLIGLFIFLVLRIFWLAKNYRDRFGQLILYGFGTIIGVQAFFNMGAITGILPLTGVPLPFISYGGTALAVFLTMSGIIVNISKYS